VSGHSAQNDSITNGMVGRFGVHNGAMER
jgi:hypothetical protein